MKIVELYRFQGVTLNKNRDIWLFQEHVEKNRVIAIFFVFIRVHFSYFCHD